MSLNAWGSISARSTSRHGGEPLEGGSSSLSRAAQGDRGRLLQEPEAGGHVEVPELAATASESGEEASSNLACRRRVVPHVAGALAGLALLSLAPALVRRTGDPHRPTAPPKLLQEADALPDALPWRANPEVWSPLVCNAQLESRKLWPRKKWALTPSQQEACYDGVVNRVALEKRKHIGGLEQKEGRNWCWVGWKEFGCHSTLFADNPRPHESWDEMHLRASWVNASTGPMPSGDYHPLLAHDLCDKEELGAPRIWTAEEWHEAWVWFSRYVTVYVINLKSNTARWRAVHGQLNKLDINHTRVWGVDMREPDALQRAKDEGLVPQSYDFDRAQREATGARQDMGGILGTVGCASAHFRAQQTAYLHGTTPMALVFEDDVLPQPDFVPRLWALARQELPCDWQVVSLRSMCPYGRCISAHLTRVEPDVNEPEDRCRHGVNYGFQAVLYRVKDIPKVQPAWQKVVFNESRPHCLDVDVALASLSENVGFYAVPFVQSPGFLTERRDLSSRYMINLDEED